MRQYMMRSNMHIRSVLIFAVVMAACGPRAHIPTRPSPESLPDAISPADSGWRLARSLAPILFIQRDEFFPLERVVAVLHPARRIIAYHLLWRDDVHGSWVPFTVPTDEEIVWVGYDSTNAPTDVWTFWHGTLLHTPWRGRGVGIDVQWGKHGSLPRGIVESDLPGIKKLNDFYALHYIGIIDMWLGKLTRPGPGCFCHGYRRYREFTDPIVLGDRIDVVARAVDPRSTLVAVFGKPYSKKRPWP
jgi:hypothetical protein